MKKTLLLFFCALSFSAIKAQNSCSMAMAISLGTYSVDDVNGAIQTTSCTTAQLTGAAEWYTFTPTEDIAVFITSDMTPYQDTRLFVFTGDCTTGLQCEAFDDDSGANYSSSLAISLSANTTYYIVWDNFWNPGGFNFSITETEIVAPLIGFDTDNAPVNAFGGADFNGDHLDDLVEINFGTINVALQQEDGSFIVNPYSVNSITHSPSWSFTMGDLNEDGMADLICGGGEGVSILMSNPSNNSFTEFISPIYIFSQRGNCVDMDNDGKLDVFMCHDIAPNVRFMNNGNNTFETIQGGLGDTPDGGNYGSVWIDYDNDCDMDLFIAKCRGGLSEASRNQLHRNNGDGTFTDVSEASGLADYVQTWSSAWGDFDNDGDMDVVVGASSFTTGHHKVMRNNGDGTFTDVTAGSGWDTFNGTSIEYQAGDFDNDGRIDVIGGGNYIALNNGDFTFTFSPSAVGSGSIGDFNNDGFLDVVSFQTIFYNEGNDNNYIKVATVGTESNLDGIGARVTITTASGEQIREIRSGEGFRHMSSLNAHFGIGTETAVEKIHICWPSGIEDEILNPAINTLHVIEEGSFGVNVTEQIAREIEIYPNPATDILTVKNGSEWLGAQVLIHDATGKMMSSETLNNNQIRVNQLPAGFYTMKLIKGKNTISKTFLKQ